MSKKPSTVSRKPAKGTTESKGLPMDFWAPKTLAELTAEQGIQPIERLEEVLGQGAKLWQDDAEFEEFLAQIREARRRRE